MGDTRLKFRLFHIKVDKKNTFTNEYTTQNKLNEYTVICFGATNLFIYKLDFPMQGKGKKKEGMGGNEDEPYFCAKCF